MRTIHLGICLWLASLLLAVEATAFPSYNFTDTTVIIAQHEYDAWGNVLAVRDASGALLAASAAGNRFLFQGREYSHATKLHNFRARWYDPSSARWLSPDPIGLEGGVELV